MGSKKMQKDVIMVFNARNIVYLPAGKWYDKKDEWGVVWRYFTDAYAILDWGTTEGLGQLANNGPTDSTVFSAVEWDDSRIPIECVHGLWEVKDPSLFKNIMEESYKKLLSN
jgi:hypothetical protein